MPIIKCKMCGGDLSIIEGMTVAECEYCGTKQTVPNVDNEKKATLFSRANRLLRNCEFDKAAGVYENIVVEFQEEAEAYWGLMLCKYGIEYVDDPATGKKVPTCHRSSFDSLMDDNNFEQVMENADVVARKVYREEAKAIEEIRKGIIEVSGREEPYDIFICYKEADENGARTIDSVLAQDIYGELVKKGYRVFFSRITLEDKLGQEYEPYIFAALNSAKVMLAIGTDYEYYNAVWVKNEWSRFLSLIAAGQKKILIPCYKNIDAYDIPKEFAKLQAQDLGKVGAVQDLLRGLDKIFDETGTSNVQIASIGLQMQAQEQTKADNTVQLGLMAMNSGDIEKGIQYFEEAIKINANHVGAYLGLVRAIEGKKNKPYCSRLESFPLEAVSEYLKQNPEMLVSHPVSLLDRVICSVQSIHFIKAILEAGADPNDEYILYHAIIAARQDKYDLIKLLLDYGADVNKEYKLQIEDVTEVHTPLADVIYQTKDVSLAELLIDSGADIDYVIECSNCNSYSLLDMAVRIDSLSIVQLLLEKGAYPDSGRIDSRHYKGTPAFFSALSEAIRNVNNIDIVRKLLEYGANPNYEYNDIVDLECSSLQHGIEGCSSLYDVVEYSNNSEMLELLLGAGASSNVQFLEKDFKYDAIRYVSILTLAKREGNTKIVELLTKALQKEELKTEQASLQNKLSNLSGLFADKKRKKIEARLTEIEVELKA